MLLELPVLLELLHFTLGTFMLEFPSTEATCLSFVQNVVSDFNFKPENLHMPFG